MRVEDEIPRSFLVCVNRRFAELCDIDTDERNQLRCYHEHASNEDKQKY